MPTRTPKAAPSATLTRDAGGRGKANPIGWRVWSAGRWLVLAAALAITFTAFFLTGMRVATRAREVKVPDVRGKSVSEAAAALADAGLLFKEETPRRPDAKVARDHVLTQDPEPGTVLRRQRSVRIRVSDGQRDPVLPSVAGQPERTAELSLAQEGIQVAGKDEIRSGDFPEGTVVAQDPPARSRAPAVTLLVNRGQAGGSYVMPDLIGTPGQLVQDLLRKRGLRIMITATVLYPGIPPGIVIRQTPQAGFQIGDRELISIEVSK
ncbi:MAG TPA: PASTA domain-containing protein [Vicinamibacterales bacterium]|nr:PASTA domain-containing protein [Vicinamibacterales bacterium]